MVAHAWRDCYPAIADRETHDVDPALTAKARVVFQNLPEQDRMLFHQAVCHDRDSVPHQNALAKVKDVLREKVI